MPDELNQTLRDTAYVAVGFGLLGFQRAQVRRHELARRFQGVARSVDDAVAPALAGVDRRVEELAGHLPEPGRAAVATLRTAAGASEQLLRQLTGVERRPPR